LRPLTARDRWSQRAKWIRDSPSGTDSDDDIAQDAMKISQLIRVDAGRTGVSMFMA
jgi:hypothetical protein